MTMLCPRDRQGLIREVLAGIDIDTCTYCDGTWLDAGETARVIGMVDDMVDGKKVSVEELNDRYPGQRLLCPRCENAALEPHYFSADKNLIIDRCPKCHGIWLDTGELKDAIVTAYKEFNG